MTETPDETFSRAFRQAAKVAELERYAERTEQHRNDLMDSIVSLRTEVAALRQERDALIATAGEHITVRAEYLARATAAEAQAARMQQAISLATDVLVTVETDAVSYPRLYKKAAAAVKAIRALAQEPQE